MSWTDGDETFPVEITGRVRFRIAISADVRGLTDDVPAEVIENVSKRISALLNGSKEQCEAAIFAELNKRVPGMTFGFDDTPPDLP